MANPIDMNKQKELFSIPASHHESLLIKNGLRFYSFNCFSIPRSITSRFYSYYKLLYWSGDYLLHVIDNNEGSIFRSGIEFRTVFHREVTRGYIMAHRGKQFAISFRAVDSKYELPSIALISAATID